MILLREYDIIYGTLIIDEGMSDERLFLSDSSERPSYIYICMNKKYTLTVLGVCMRDIICCERKRLFFCLRGMLSDECDRLVDRFACLSWFGTIANHQGDDVL